MRQRPGQGGLVEWIEIDDRHHDVAAAGRRRDPRHCDQGDNRVRAADLTARLQATRAAVYDPALVLIVVGEFKQGKSTLVNVLLGIDVCAVHDDIATAVPTLIRHGDRVGTRRPLRRCQG